MEHKNLNKPQNSPLQQTAVSSSFSLSTLQSFLDFEKEQKKVMRGDIEMYDLKGHHKYLTFGELFNWYVGL